MAQHLNKALLAHSQAHSFTYCLWLVLHYSHRDEQLHQRLYGPQSLKLYYLVLYRRRAPGNSLAVQWLGLRASTSGGTGLIPGRGTKIPQAARLGQKKKSVPTPEIYGCPMLYLICPLLITFTLFSFVHHYKQFHQWDQWARTWRNVNSMCSHRKTSFRDFPGGPVVRTPHFHCRGHRVDPWSGN